MATNNAERRTGVESVFEHLYAEIVSMRLRPGTKISEAEMARQFGVSRQPVRDAFSRLENLDLLLIRPQKATEVKRFSAQSITTARFVRLAVETEVLRRAARLCDSKGAALLKKSLDAQVKAVKSADDVLFRTLDYDFHQALCEVGQVSFAFEVIQEQKAKVDRLCVLELSKDQRLDQLLEDHVQIADMVSSNNEGGAVEAGALHLSRLDATLETIQQDHGDYFTE